MLVSKLLSGQVTGLCELDTSILEVLGQPRRRDAQLLARDNWTKLGWWDWLFGIQKARVRPVIIRLTLGEWNRFVNGVSPQYQMQVSRPTILCRCEQIANTFLGRGRDRRESALRLAASRAFWSCGMWENQTTARQFLERSATCSSVWRMLRVSEKPCWLNGKTQPPGAGEDMCGDDDAGETRSNDGRKTEYHIIITITNIYTPCIHLHITRVETFCEVRIETEIETHFRFSWNIRVELRGHHDADCQSCKVQLMARSFLGLKSCLQCWKRARYSLEQVSINSI